MENLKLLLIGWLAKQGCVLANDSPDVTILTSVQKAFTDAAAPAQSLANEKETLDGKITTLETGLTAEKARALALENERNTAQAALKTERARRIEASVDLACVKGKVIVADRAARIAALENSKDLDADLTKMLGEAVKVKTTADAVSGKVLSNDGADADADPRDAYMEGLAAHMKATGETDPLKGHASFKKKCPALVEALKNRDAAAATAK